MVCRWLASGASRVLSCIAVRQSPKETAKLAPPSPRNGNRLPMGAHPKNTGGKKGRSGPKALDFYLQCRGASDAFMLPKAIEVVKTRSPITKTGKPDLAYWACANWLSKFAYAPVMPAVQMASEGGRVTVTLDLGET